MIAHERVEVREQSQVGSARRLACSLACRSGLSETDGARAALVATELATNLLKHGGGGDLLLRSLGPEDGRAGLELIAVDTGRGITSLAAALRDGYSTAGSSGTGLGAIARAGDLFDAYSRPDGGSVFTVRILAAAAPNASGPAAAYEGSAPGTIAGVCVPHPAETVSGDAWWSTVVSARRSVLVIDGLGHGAQAADAALAGVDLFRRSAGATPAEAVQRLHAGLRATRGAALAVADIDPARATLRYAGIGNIASTILTAAGSRSLVSHHGTAGHDARRIQEFAYDFPRGAALLMHSDGVTARWSLAPYPGLLDRHPLTVAAVLYRDFSRGRDDATVVVVKDAA